MSYKVLKVINVRLAVALINTNREGLKYDT